MKKILSIILLSLVALGLRGQQVGLTLQQCKDMALVNDPYVKNSYLDVMAAEAQKKEVFAEHFPRVGFSAFGFYAQKPMISLTAIDIFGDNDLGNLIHEAFAALAEENGGSPEFTALKYGFNASLTLVQPIYAGGRIAKGNELASLGVKAANLKKDIQVRTKNEDVEKSYWEIVALEEKRSTLKHLNELLDVLHKDVTSGIEAGLITDTDLLLVNMKKNELKSGEIQLEGGIRLLKMNLFNAIGQPYSVFESVANEQTPYIDNIVLQDRLSDLRSPQEYYVPEEELAQNVQETQLLGMMVEAKKLEKRLALGEVLPTVAIGGSYGYAELNGRQFNGNVFAMVQIPISEWGKASRKLDRLEHQVQKSQNEKDYLTSQLLLQIRQFWLNLNVAWEKMNVAKENVELANKTVSNQMSEFEAGMIPLSDLLMTQTKLYEATEAYVNSQIEYSKALTTYLGRKTTNNN
jgi:outer membrane protein TolC